MSASYSPEQRGLILARYRGALEAERATDSEVRRAVTQMQADLTESRWASLPSFAAPELERVRSTGTFASPTP